VTIVKRGSLMHMQTAKMGAYTMSPPPWDPSTAITPWMVRSYYTPWERQYYTDANFNPPIGTKAILPIFAPNISTKALWTRAN
jgi:hypothetical protein